MKFIRATERYINTFYLFGHCLYPLRKLLRTDNDHQESESIFTHLKVLSPLICSNALNFGLCGLAILWIQTTANMDQSSKTLSFLFALCQVLRVTTVFYQSVFKTVRIREIIQIFRWTELFFKNNLMTTVPYTLFLRKFCIKVIAIFLFCMQAITFYSFQRIDINHAKWIGIISRILLLLSTFSIFHIIFYTDLLTFNLHHLNSIIVRDTEQYTTTSMSIAVASDKKRENGKMLHENMRKYKLVHYRLWQVSQLINDYFGWSIIALMLQCFVDIVYSLYWEIKVLYLNFTFDSLGM